MGREKRSRTPPRSKLETADFAALGIDAPEPAVSSASADAVTLPPMTTSSVNQDATGLIAEPGPPAFHFCVTQRDAPPPGPPDALKKYYIEL